MCCKTVPLKDKKNKSVPLTLPECPAGDDPEGDHEDEEDGPGTDCHQGLQHKSRVEVDPVKKNIGLLTIWTPKQNVVI
jgi:hypothetical protein